jgi:pilus assembly protein Flp/PilA
LGATRIDAALCRAHRPVFVCGNPPQTNPLSADCRRDVRGKNAFMTHKVSFVLKNRFHVHQASGVNSVPRLNVSVPNRFAREDGATMVEYGLMVALIAVVCLLAVTALGVNIQGVFNQIAGAV